MWPFTHRIGKDIKASSWFFSRRAAKAYLMTGDRHDELAALYLGMTTS